MKKEAKTLGFLGIGEVENLASVFAAKHLETLGDPTEQYCSMVQNILPQAIKQHKYEIATDVVVLAEKIYIDHGVTQAIDLGQAIEPYLKPFREKVRNDKIKIYWMTFKWRALPPKLPDKLKFRMWLMSQLLVGWRAMDLEEAHQVFRFLIAAIAPKAKDCKRLPEESDHEMTARGNNLQDEEVDEILKLVRKRNETFSAEEVAWWLIQPHIPEVLEKELGMCWAKKVAPHMFSHAIRCIKIIEPFGLPNRSPEAVEALQREAGTIAAFDRMLQDLLQRLEKHIEESPHRSEDGIITAATLAKLIGSLREPTIRVLINPKYPSEKIAVFIDGVRSIYRESLKPKSRIAKDWKPRIFVEGISLEKTIVIDR